MYKLFKSATLIALTVFGAVAIQSCKKGEEDPGLTLRSRDGRLAGTWMVMEFTSSDEDMTEYSDPDPDFDGNTVENNSNSSVTWDGTNLNMTETSESIDDDGSKSMSETSMTNGTFSVESSYTSGGTTISSDQEGTYTASWMAEYTFDKDGSFSMTSSQTIELTIEESNSDFGYDVTTTTSETEDETISGTWAWLGANKVDEIENEERVAIWYADESTSYVEEEEEDYTDTDDDDFYDWDDEDNSSKDETTSTWKGNDTEPDEIWTLTQLKNKEMKAMVEGSYSSTNVTKYSQTSGGTTVSSTSDSESTGSSMAEITFEKQD